MSQVSEEESKRANSKEVGYMALFRDLCPCHCSSFHISTCHNAWCMPLAKLLKAFWALRSVPLINQPHLSWLRFVLFLVTSAFTCRECIILDMTVHIHLTYGTFLSWSGCAMLRLYSSFAWALERSRFRCCCYEKKAVFSGHCLLNLVCQASSIDNC